MSATPTRNIAKICPSSTAFFVCDIQERFRSFIHAYPNVISTAQKMITAANHLDIPIIVTEQNPKALGKTVQELDISKAKCNLGKSKFSMFLPEVETLLKNDLKTKSVVLFGIESHICVLQTCLDLLEQNYEVYVLADGVSSMNYPEIDIALARMQQAGATITTSESILFQLVGDAKHQKFKGISGLTKEYQKATKDNKLLFKSRI
ncbi:Isochorismatase hydrolase [Basidiobolus meristosporus CBS 931.73]|uniref:Isochorismatase hydrolase n=1 Tax=Basidiobolus meristosporus CBS 931.73 TaxID=1314790 RepID=A0A1Y1YC20_9FUNG|nr:Isochorismatase hydrolase [Basidiobolus meristosporus CBS 931.73]|eukprot:ORX95580.1 Isochorismatase hydrolase [Basidiobolus meristosporus CBS 931.73]